MDCSTYEAAESGDVGFLRYIDIHRLLQKTPQDNNVLHIAAENKQIHFFEQFPLYRLVSALFWATNKKGDTPLHVAARVGSDEIVRFLIERETNHGKANKNLLRMSNRKKDTALHVAARSGHAGVVSLLMAADPHLCCLTNAAKESPLFIATRQGYPLIAHSILNDCPIPPSCDGFNGVTALHVAVTHASEEFNIGILETMVAKNPDIIKKKDDQLGWTPLHHAALRGNIEATRLLMQSDSSVSYILDKSGMSALHVAAYAGHTNIMEELIRFRPDVCDLLNKKGETVLHAAVLGGQIDVIAYSLNVPKLAVLINEADTNGNTPLHLAAFKKNREVIRTLARDPRVDKNAINENLSKASDIFLCDNMGEQELFGSSTVLDYRSASSVGLPFFQHQIIHDFWNLPVNDTFSTVDSKEKVQRRESKLLIATLIATVTFAAAFTVPGGVRSDGKAVLYASIHFTLFKVFNLLSFSTSAFVIYNEVVDSNLLPTSLVAILIQFSVGAMVVAFCTGMGAMQNVGNEREPSLYNSIYTATWTCVMFLLVPKMVIIKDGQPVLDLRALLPKYSPRGSFTRHFIDNSLFFILAFQVYYLILTLWFY